MSEIALYNYYEKYSYITLKCIFSSSTSTGTAGTFSITKSDSSVRWYKSIMSGSSSQFGLARGLYYLHTDNDGYPYLMFGVATTASQSLIYIATTTSGSGGLIMNGSIICAGPVTFAVRAPIPMSAAITVTYTIYKIV